MTDYFRDRDYSHSPRDPEGRPYGEADPATLDWSEGRPLIDHLNGTGDKAKNHAAKLDLENYALWMGRWHDLGKYRPNFQDYLRGLRSFPNPEDKSHKWAGAAWANALAGGAPMAWLIAGHHGGLLDRTSLRAFFNDPAKTKKGQLGQAHVELNEVIATGRVPESLLQKPEFTLHPNFSPKAPYATLELMLRFLFSMLVDADHTDTAEHFDPEQATTRDALHAQQNSLAELKHKLDTHLDAFRDAPDTPVNRMRAQVLHHCREAAAHKPGLFHLTVPTGGGKTLSSMAFALDHALTHRGLNDLPYERIIVVLPFTSIIEQSAATYRAIFGEANVLEHHANWEADEDNADKRNRAAYQHKLLCENWDAPIIVTTAVQFLETLHAHKTSRCRKLHRVLNSVVVMDEVQTLPVHLLRVTLDTLAALVADFGTSLVLCTATQPALSEPDILRTRDRDTRCRNILPQPHPIIPPDVERAMFDQMRRVQVHTPLENEHPDDWSALTERASSHRDVLIIVDRRQAAYELAQDLGEDWLYLSGAMVAAHRSWVVAEVKRRLAADIPCKLVSTQIIEAGVDVDFPVVYRAMAGYEALAQSAGRCNRNGLRRDDTNGEPIPGDFYLFLAPQAPPKGLLKAGYSIARSGFKNQAIDLHDPALFPTYFRDLYQSAQLDAKELMPARKDHALRQIGENYQLIDNKHQVQVVVPWSAEALAALYPDDGSLTEKEREQRDKMLGQRQRFELAFQRYREAGKPDKGDMRLLNQSMVAVPEKVVRRLMTEGAVRPLHDNCPVPFLDLETYRDYYDARLGFRYFEDYELDPALCLL
ncbi:CRISPR-associated helicase Cas3' [Acanthopleuribacter pedis]|uniref:CRISPR-associated helicase Cas3 n=1 Tax=Acanthopleuribacter pedis TaxID=442870 RepID=A0A8J7U3A9_9BACT|nr:CRISPR-associated helicase Cas3' [Acanthopleuribacter pedis]